MMELDKNELLAEIISTLPAPLQSDEITARMLSDSTGYSIQGARQYLAKLTKKDVLSRREALHEGKIVMAYKKKG